MDQHAYSLRGLWQDDECAQVIRWDRLNIEGRSYRASDRKAPYSVFDPKFGEQVRGTLPGRKIPSLRSRPLASSGWRAASDAD